MPVHRRSQTDSTAKAEYHRDHFMDDTPVVIEASPLPRHTHQSVSYNAHEMLIAGGGDLSQVPKGGAKAPPSVLGRNTQVGQHSNSAAFAENAPTPLSPPKSASLPRYKARHSVIARAHSSLHGLAGPASKRPIISAHD